MKFREKIPSILEVLKTVIECNEMQIRHRLEIDEINNWECSKSVSWQYVANYALRFYCDTVLIYYKCL